jgi:hypothetical protein
MIFKYLFLTLFFLLTHFFSQAQNDYPYRTAKVFLDCTVCPHQFIRQNTDFVDFVRDRKVADIHLLITRQFQGGGGREYQLNFESISEAYDINYTYKITTYQADTRIEINRKLTNAIKAGLLPYVASLTPVQLVVEREAPSAELSAAENTNDDPWNFWIFEIAGSLDWEKESNQREYELDGEVEIDRTTEKWRVRSEFDIEFEVNEVQQDSQKLVSSLKRSGAEISVVKSINNHWSAGLFSGINSSTFNNIELGGRLQAALEYSYFPYRLSATKEFTFAYLVGPRYFNYWEPTVFGELEEGLMAEAIRVNFEMRQAWGTIDARLEGSHFFHDFSKNRLEFYSFLSLRVFKGLFVRVGGEANLINDQLFLPQGDASLEEILLQRRALATDFRLEFRFGVAYTFGSIYNSVVNTRL